MISGSGRFPGEGIDNPLQYSCLEYPIDRGAWWATVHGVAKGQTRLSDFTSLHFTGYKINTEKFLAFLYAYNERSEKEIK